uniref:Uncharacterized protein n=3 Tax=Oryza TaxID=4527 RepID=Q53PI9_ORYSJ|nr:hypothetical protein LOC_Os11g24210 [Oryza sativa Japonica Group]ABA93262.1 hypothetical protein LOC_Os11g24210 [Oryza sativa Japonica Group]
MYKQGADASTEAEANEKGEQPAVAAAGPLVKRERRGRRGRLPHVHTHTKIFAIYWDGKKTNLSFFYSSFPFSSSRRSCQCVSGQPWCGNAA